MQKGASIVWNIRIRRHPSAFFGLTETPGQFIRLFPSVACASASSPRSGTDGAIKGWHVTVKVAHRNALSLRCARAGYCCSIAALLVFFGSKNLQNAVAQGETRTISFHHIHTDEQLTVTYKVNGRYDEEALRKINNLMRDWRESQSIAIDPHLIDLLWEVHREVGSDEECIAVIKRYLSFFPSHCEERPPVMPVVDPSDRMDDDLLDVQHLDVVRGPLGGLAWHHLQYVLGLRAELLCLVGDLGCRRILADALDRYGRDALIQHGPLKGGWLTVRRLCKCHPLSEGWKYDPVPPVKT